MTGTQESAFPPPEERELLHKRDIVLRGYSRKDGRWDIEGWLTDTKAYGFDSTWRGRVDAGTPVHDMGLRLTVDDDLVIHDVAALMRANPYPVCPAITANFRRLVGLKIGGGFNKEARARVGGVEGCTHLVELLGPLATTAMQTIYPRRKMWRSDAKPDPAMPPRRPALIDSCHSFRSDGDVVRRQWPDFYTGPKGG